jgi:hypothetical protein
MACEDEVTPVQERIGSVADEPISKRSTTPGATCCMSPAPVPANHLLVSGVDPASGFLVDLA